MGDKILTNRYYMFFFLIVCLFSLACSDNDALSCKSGTTIILKDPCVLSVRVKFSFEDEKGVREFKIKENKVMFALRLALRQQESSMLRGMGKRNVINAIKSISKQLLDEKITRLKIIEYNFKNRSK